MKPVVVLLILIGLAAATIYMGTVLIERVDWPTATQVYNGLRGYP